MKPEKIINIEQITYIEFQCQICGQKGHSPYSQGICPRCHGKGKLIQKINPGKYIEKGCRVCHGSGYNTYSHGECNYCHGSGKEFIPLN